MRTYTIPVAFHVKGDSEVEAAKHLAARLVNRKVLDLYVDEPIESWWMPNHPAADGSDEEQGLLWVDLGYTHPSTPEERQKVVDAELEEYAMGVGYMIARRILRDDMDGLVFEREDILKAMDGYYSWGDGLQLIYEAIRDNLSDAGLIIERSPDA